MNIHFRLTPDEYRAIARAAGDVAPSEWCRAQAITAAGKTE